jgi:hypothetical protein
MITLRPFAFEDWFAIEEPVEPFAGAMTSNLEEALKLGWGGTAEDDGKVMACGGVIDLDDAECVVWLRVSKHCLETNPVTYARGIYDGWKAILKVTEKGKKISSYILKDFKEGLAMARLLKLEKGDEELTYGGKTYVKYIRVV